MLRELAQPFLDVCVLNRIARRFRQSLRLKSPLHLDHVLFAKPTRFQKCLHLRNRREIIAFAGYPRIRINRLRYQMLWVFGEQFDQPRRVDLRVAGLDRWIITDQSFRRFRRHSHSF